MKGILYPLEVLEFKFHRTIIDGSYIKVKVDVDFIKSMNQSTARVFFNEILEDYNLMCLPEYIWYIAETERPVHEWTSVKKDDKGLSEEIFMRVKSIS